MMIDDIRPATTADLPELHAIWYATEVEGDPAPPPRGAPLPTLGHILATGTLLVCERGGRIVGFAGLIRRGEVAFLTDLFVRPDVQSSGIGSALLRRILPGGDGVIRCTLASGDPRAVALYIRAGMRPRWPHFWLRAEPARLGGLPETGVVTVEADPGDAELRRWDAELSGRDRPEDLRFLLGAMDAVPLWFSREGRRIGYGYVQRRSPESLWYPDAYRLGPIGARSTADAVECALAGVRWARGRADVLWLAVPGPHAALAGLLDAGFQIAHVETFLSSEERPFADVARYVPTGSTFF